MIFPRRRVDVVRPTVSVQGVFLKFFFFTFISIFRNSINNIMQVTLSTGTRVPNRPAVAWQRARKTQKAEPGADRDELLEYARGLGL